MEPGSRIGPWVIDAELGRGGMGSVFACHHHAAKRMRRALKVLEPTAMPNAHKRFVREAEILFELNHPAVVDVVDLALEHDPPYLVMELIDGEPLDRRLRRGPVPVGDACRWFSALASGLDHAHRKGVRHRDLKPANIMITGDTPKLVDFGIAVHADRTRLTKAGMKFGSMSYTPPELFDHPDIDDELRDVYALGVVLFETLTGRSAFPEPKGVPLHVGWAQLQSKKVHGGPLDPGTSFPRPLRELVKAATHPDPKRRLRNMGEFLDRMDRVYAGSAGDDESVVVLTTDDITDSLQRQQRNAVAPAAPDSSGSTVKTVLTIAVLALVVLFILVVSGVVGASVALLLLS